MAIETTIAYKDMGIQTTIGHGGHAHSCHHKFKVPTQIISEVNVLKNWGGGNYDQVEVTFDCVVFICFVFFFFLLPTF